MFKKVSLLAAVAAFAVLALPVSALAHVVVKPAEIGVGAFQTFTTGVPNEKEGNPTVGVRVVMPDGLQYVSPTVKPGWKIDVKKEGEGESAKVTEISWTEGSIPAGQRDDFTFSAKVPSNETTLQWKAYQTYADGTVVSWDQEPSEKQGTTPYSQTKVLNDLAKKDSATETTSPANKDAENRANIALGVGGIALLIAVAAVVRSSKK